MINEIIFPGINLKLKISRIAFKVFNIEVYWYAIIIVIGIIIALILCKKSKEKYGILYEDIIESLIFALPIGLICARLYYCFFNLENYIANPLKIFNVKDGGIAIYGGIIGAAITLFIYCKIKKIDFLDLWIA